MSASALPALSLPAALGTTHNDSSEQTAQYPITWDVNHASPYAGFALISNDHYGYKVETWRLEAFSGLIKDTIELSNATAAIAYIHLPYAHQVIETFVNMLSVTPVYSTIALSGFEDMYKLCEYFQAPDLVQRVGAAMMLRLRMMKRGSIEPWDTFKLAASQHDHELMKAAVEAFGNSRYSFERIVRSPIEFYEGVPLEYVVQLMTASMNPRQYTEQEDHGLDDLSLVITDGYEPRSWPMVARAFGKACKARD